MSAPSFQTIVSSWRLLLLGSTGVVLSIASGWTTWDGMRNFTKEPLLSLMITFGIQGVMLIAAWLIGESFAAGLGRYRLKSRGGTTQRFQVITGSGIGILLFLAVGLLLFIYFDFFQQDQNSLGAAGSWAEKIHAFRFVILAFLVIALFLVAGGRDVLDDYLRSLRVIVRNAVLWVIFLVCMATSVFFSFDSLFSTIFSEKERLRAADLRTQSEVASIVTDIVGLTAQRRLEERTALLNSDDWLRYGRTLDQLASELKAAPASIDRFLQKGERDEQKVAALRQAELSQVEKERAQLSKRKAQLSARILQLQDKAGQLAATVKTLNQQIFEKDREVITKSAEAEAEARGIGVTSRPGRGPIFRELEEEHRRLKETKKNLELQLRAYSERLEATRKAIVGPEGEVAAIKSKLLQLDNQASTARNADGSTRRTRLAGSLRSETQAALQRLASDRIAFEQDPTRAGLDALQSRCSKIVGFMSGSPVLTSKVKTSSCDPGKTHESAARLYALNGGATALGANCSAEKSLHGSAGVESQLALARTCLRLSGLSTTDVADMRSGINGLERNRDDKAHRFVVTTNAFSDGNRLAYLALAIAVAIDALVFMSGLFGAAAARSPASPMPRHDRRMAGQFEAMIESALLPNVFDNATSALENIKPVADPASSGPGADWTHELDLDDPRIASLGTLRKILNAGVAAHAVQRDPTRPELYFLRSDFVEVLHDAARQAFDSDQRYAGLTELKDIVAIALRPDSGAHAGTVLNYLRPSSEKAGYSSQLIMSEVNAGHAAMVRRCLNAAATVSCVHCVGDESDCDRFLVHKDLYRVLALMSAELPPMLAGPDEEPAVQLIEHLSGTSGRHQAALTYTEPPTVEGDTGRPTVEAEPEKESTAEVLEPVGDDQTAQVQATPKRAERQAVEKKSEKAPTVELLEPMGDQVEHDQAAPTRAERSAVEAEPAKQPAAPLFEPIGDQDGQHPATPPCAEQQTVEDEPDKAPSAPLFDPIGDQAGEHQAAPLSAERPTLEDAPEDELTVSLFDPIGEQPGLRPAAPTPAEPPTGEAKPDKDPKEPTAPLFEPIGGQDRPQPAAPACAERQTVEDASDTASRTEQISSRTGQRQAASGRRRAQYAGADSPAAEKRAPLLRYRTASASAPAEAAPPVARAPVVKATADKTPAKGEPEKLAKLKPRADRPRPRISITDDTITFD